MSTIIKELIAKFTADTSEIEGGSSKAITAITSFGKAAGVAAAAAAAAFGALAIHEAHVGDELGKASDRAGEATDAFIQLGHATELAGLSTEGLSNVLKFMQKNVYDAAAGNKDLEASLRRIGTSSKELLALDPAEAFKKITAGIGGLGSAAERTKIAMELLGRSGTDVLSLAKKGAEYFKEMADEADRFGLTITRVDSEQLNDANDAVEKIGMAASGAARQFSVGLAPAISTSIERMLKVVSVADMFRSAGEWLGKAWVEALDKVMQYITAFRVALTEGQILVNKFVVESKKLVGSDATEAQKRVDELTKSSEALKKQMADREAGKYGFVADYTKNVNEAQAANAKLKLTVSKGMGGGQDVPLSQAALDEARKAAQKYAQEVKKSIEATVEYNNTIADQFISIKDGFLQGGKAADVFKKTALNALNEIANNMIKMSFGGAGGGGLFGSIASSLMGGFGGPLGGGSTYSKQFGRIDWLPSFAVGTDYVPRDMVANIHEGERIVPKGENLKGSGGTVNQTIVVNAGVSQTVRAEMLRLLPQIKQQAVQATRDADARGIRS